MIDNLLKTYDEQRYRFRHDETVSIVVWKLDTLVDRIHELEAENADLRERVADLEQELELKKYEMLDLMERC